MKARKQLKHNLLVQEVSHVILHFCSSDYSWSRDTADHVASLDHTSNHVTLGLFTDYHVTLNMFICLQVITWLYICLFKGYHVTSHSFVYRLSRDFTFVCLQVITWLHICLFTGDHVTKIFVYRLSRDFVCLFVYRWSRSPKRCLCPVSASSRNV